MIEKEQMVGILLTIPLRVIDSIDDVGKELSLRRGPVTRMYLVKSLEIYSNVVLEVIGEWEGRPQEECLPVTLQISEETNRQLEELCKKIPLSKKRLGELLVMKAVQDHLA